MNCDIHNFMLMSTHINKVFKCFINSKALRPEMTYNRKYSDIKLEDYEKLYSSEPKVKNKIKEILNQYEDLKYNTLGEVPTVISINSMRKMIESCYNIDQIRASITQLFVTETSFDGHRLSKVQTDSQLQIEKDNADSSNIDRLRYDSNNLSLWTGCDKYSKNISINQKLAQAAKFGPKLVFDLSYVDQLMMNKDDSWACANQLNKSIGKNRSRFAGVFDIWLSHWNPNNAVGTRIQHLLKDIDDVFITMLSGCFTEVFNKDKIVYLSPDAPEVLHDPIFGDDTVYVIGGLINGPYSKLPLSLKRAQELGLKAKRLPMACYTELIIPNKSLSMDNVTRILCDCYKTNSIDAALSRYIAERQGRGEYFQFEARMKYRNYQRNLISKKSILDPE